MKWDNIEASWLEMARRATGDAGGTGPAGPVDPLAGPASADDGSVVASTVTAALAAVVLPDRSVA